MFAKNSILHNINYSSKLYFIIILNQPKKLNVIKFIRKYYLLVLKCIFEN
jgi:hypothetical protein